MLTEPLKDETSMKNDSGSKAISEDHKDNGQHFDKFKDVCFTNAAAVPSETKNLTVRPYKWKATRKTLTSNEKPFKCPVCEGSGLVEDGFYEIREPGQFRPPGQEEQCRSCKGTGIVWK